jgi:hypothetical protein
VNHDNMLNVNDVTTLIAYILGTTADVCTTCGNVNGDNDINVADVTTLIAIILNQ